MLNLSQGDNQRDILCSVGHGATLRLFVSPAVWNDNLLKSLMCRLGSFTLVRELIAFALEAQDLTFKW